MQKQGFSLVELSIVLVILGLLVGGILAGQSLIRASELRSVSADYSKYQTAVYAFRDKYFALPGDMANAVKFWGAQTGSTADGVDSACAALTTASTTPATCNGDGSGFIADGATPGDVRLQWYESYRMWQHLANAGLAEGSFSGVSGNGQALITSNPGVNVPASKIGNRAGWTMRSMIVSFDDPNFFAIFGNYLVLGNPGNTSASVAVLRPEEAWNIDVKLDDSMPALGRVRPYKQGGTVNPNCTVNATTSTGYDLTNTAIACSLNFLLK